EGGTVVRLAERIRDNLIGEPTGDVTATDDVATLISRHAGEEVDAEQMRVMMDALEKDEAAKANKLIS
ncbi:MAG: hypothetical protein WCZ23_17945, partial [Rhodospirillaceae bacterium]